MTFENYQSLVNDYLMENYDKYIDLSLKREDFYDLDGRSYYRGKADMCLELVGFLFGSSLMIHIYKDKDLSSEFVEMLKVLGNERKEEE